MSDSPPLRLPTGVRTASTMTVSRIDFSARAPARGPGHRPSAGERGLALLGERRVRLRRVCRREIARLRAGLVGQRLAQVRSAPSLSSALLWASATGGPAASRPARSVDEVVDLVGAPTTQVTRPSARASSASIVSASSTSRLACCSPTSFGSSQDPPRSSDSPRLREDLQNRDSGVATTRSQPSARFHPAPTATPVTFAMVGTGSSCSASATSVSLRILYRGWMSCRVAEMSAPEQNAPPAPVSTSARTARSRPASAQRVAQRDPQLRVDRVLAVAAGSASASVRRRGRRQQHLLLGHGHGRSDRPVGPQPAPFALASTPNSREYGVGVLPEPGYRAHRLLVAGDHRRRQQRRDRPVRRVDLRATGRAPSVADARPLRWACCSASCRSRRRPRGFCMYARSCRAHQAPISSSRTSRCAHPAGVGGEPLVVGEVGAAEDLPGDPLPFTVVRRAEDDGLTVGGGVRAVRRHRGRAHARAAAGRCPSAGCRSADSPSTPSSCRTGSPRPRARAPAVRGPRAYSSARIDSAAYSPVHDVGHRRPGLGGHAGQPVTAHDPDSAWTSRSYARLWESGPPGPYPSISTGMRSGWRTARSAGAMPSLAVVPGARLETSTSARSSSRCNTAIPAGDLRSSVTDSLPRLHHTKCAARPPLHHIVVVPGEVTAVGVLHLDHPGAEVGEHAGAHGRGHRLLQRHHGDAGQRGGADEGVIGSLRRGSLRV